jgi:hypothetical protein
MRQRPAALALALLPFGMLRRGRASHGPVLERDAAELAVQLTSLRVLLVAAAARSSWARLAIESERVTAGSAGSLRAPNLSRAAHVPRKRPTVRMSYGPATTPRFWKAEGLRGVARLLQGLYMFCTCGSTALLSHCSCAWRVYTLGLGCPDPWNCRWTCPRSRTISSQ